MAGANDRFLTAAIEQGLEVEVHHFPEGTRTAEDAAAAVGCDAGAIVKSLIFTVDDQPVLALVSGRNRVDLAKLAPALGGTTAGRADADTARAASGYAIGGTPPFGHPTNLPAVLDPDLFDHETVWAAAGTADTCFPISPLELERISGAKRADIADR